MRQFGKKNEVTFDPGVDLDQKKFSISKEAWLRIACGLGAFVVTASLYQFVLIPRAETKAREAAIAEVDVNAMPKVLVPVVKPGAKIDKYTLLTEDIVNQNIDMMEVPTTMAIENPVPDKSLLVGKVTTSAMLGNSQFSLDGLTDQTDWFGQNDRLREFKITNTVGGQVKTGNIVDIIIDYGNGTYDVVASKKKVTGIKGVGQTSQSTTTTEQTNNGQTQTQTQQLTSEENEMVFSVDEKEYANLTLASKMGNFVIRLYVDEGQEPSVVTFNGASGLQKKGALKNNDATNGQ